MAPWLPPKYAPGSINFLFELVLLCLDNYSILSFSCGTNNIMLFSGRNLGKKINFHDPFIY